MIKNINLHPAFMEYSSTAQRIALHVTFWLVFTMMYAVISTAFAQPSDLAIAMPWRFLRFWAYEIAMLPLKLVAVYGLLYFLIPLYLVPRKYGLALLIVVTLLMPLLILYRLEMYYIMYPLMYGEYPNFKPIEGRRLLFSFLDFVPALASAATIKLLRQHLLSQQREKQLIHEKLQSELDFLRSQINPHFLFNTLNNIYALARRGSPHTSEVIMRLSKILRFMLYECNQMAIPLQNELKVIKDYIALEKLRYNHRLKINYDEVLEDSDRKIAPLLLLPLVENAFKHGVSESRFDSVVDIKIRQFEDDFSFVVTNEYCDHNQPKNDGIGIANVRRQLELIYPNQHQFEINYDQNKFNVMLSLQLIS